VHLLGQLYLLCTSRASPLYLLGQLRSAGAPQLDAVQPLEVLLLLPHLASAAAIATNAATTATAAATAVAATTATAAATAAAAVAAAAREMQRGRRSARSATQGGSLPNPVSPRFLFLRLLLRLRRDRLA
jgi:hypothetical protein